MSSCFTGMIKKSCILILLAGCQEVLLASKNTAPVSLQRFPGKLASSVRREK